MVGPRPYQPLPLRGPCTVVLKSLKTTEFPAAEGNELKTLEALCWKVPDSRGTFNVVYFKDLSVRVGL